MNSLKKMVQKEKEVYVIATLYVASIKTVISSRNFLLTQRQIIYIHRVDEALCLIDECHRQVILNDFINHNNKWWESIYPTELYLKLRQQAVNSFLMHFYEA